MNARLERPAPILAVIDRQALADRVRAIAARLAPDVEVMSFSSVLEVIGDAGPSSVGGVICTVDSVGPFLQDLLRWTDPGHHTERVCAAVIGRDSDEAAVNIVVGRDHVNWIDADTSESGIDEWVSAAMETHDLRFFRERHEELARALREARTKLFLGEAKGFTPPEGPPCGPPLPTNIEEIQSLRDARAQYERGLIRSAIREFGSLKDASAALGISYTSLWRRLR